MKKSIKFSSFLSLFLFVLFYSCTPTETTGGDEQAEEMTPTEAVAPAAMSDALLAIQKDTIPLDTFNTWVANWDKDGRAWMDTHKITAYNMPLIDLGEVWTEKGAVASRFYLGLQNKGKAGYEAKLMVVGVDSTNHDIMDHIYDLTKPCPNHCKAK